MCLIAFNFTPGQERHLLLAANRDEFHDRPTRVMAWWDWPGGPLAGRDEEAGGTWLAVARDGRWAAVTNFRDPNAGSGDRSRGELTSGFIDGRASPKDYVASIHDRRERYGPFNLLAGDRDELWYCSTHADPCAVAAGVHALSNGLLDEPWPKSRRAARAMRGLGDATEVDVVRLFDLLNDHKPAPDQELPETGIGMEYERFLSPPFIVGERYGTRCSTVLALGRRNLAAERSFNRAGELVSEIRYQFEPVR